MNVWVLLQIGLNLIFGLSVFLFFKRLNKPAKDDPRLSRGLQLLQSKIAILEDLSDRTEVQFSQLGALTEQKCRDVQGKIQLAEKHIQMINATIEKSLEVAKIFQDKIPHHEIIERQNTLKYVQAARMAHQGLSMEEIHEKVDLPMGELEFIVKVNRQQLMFAEEELPAWARGEQPDVSAPAESHLAPIETATPERDLSQAFEVSRPGLQSLEKLGEEFRKVCAPPTPNLKIAADVPTIEVKLAKKDPVIRKVEFPRIQMPDDLA